VPLNLSVNLPRGTEQARDLTFKPGTLIIREQFIIIMYLYVNA